MVRTVQTSIRKTSKQHEKKVSKKWCKKHWKIIKKVIQNQCQNHEKNIKKSIRKKDRFLGVPPGFARESPGPPKTTSAPGPKAPEACWRVEVGLSACSSLNSSLNSSFGLWTPPKVIFSWNFPPGNHLFLNFPLLLCLRRSPFSKFPATAYIFRKFTWPIMWDTCG